MEAGQMPLKASQGAEEERAHMPFSLASCFAGGLDVAVFFLIETG